MKSMTTGVWTAAAILVATANVQGAEVRLDLHFDDLASGQPANQALPQGLSFDNAVYDSLYNSFGEPIPNTLRWRKDPLAPEVLVDNPGLYDRGSAPSPENALEVLFQPVLLSLGGLTDRLNLKVTLDLDTYGDNGTLPGFEDIAIQLLGRDGLPLFTVPVDQTTPGYLAEAGPLNGVAEILFPAGAFYDDIHLTFDPRPPVANVIPETGTWVGAGGLVLALAATRRRRA